MRTKEKLAAALREAELPAMAGKAAQGYYDDFESELESPALQLIADLREAGTLPALGLLARAVAGEFDATLEEAEAWAATPEGRRLMEESREKSESRDGKGSVGRGGKMLLAGVGVAAAVATMAACLCREHGVGLHFEFVHEH